MARDFNKPSAFIPKLLGNAGFRVQSDSQSKAQRAVNNYSFIRVATLHWLPPWAPAGKVTYRLAETYIYK